MTEYMSDEMAELINQCWDDTPAKRPSILEVLKGLAHFTTRILISCLF